MNRHSDFSPTKSTENPLYGGNQTDEDGSTVKSYRMYNNALYSKGNESSSSQLGVSLTGEETVNQDNIYSSIERKVSNRFPLLSLLLSVVALIGVVVAIALAATRSNCGCSPTSSELISESRYF